VNGAEVPYHLRPNKFVDRQLFVDLLARVSRLRDFSKYVYISMGGKFLDDHRALHMALEVTELISIDASPEVVARQDFNKPFDSMRCLPKTAAEFVDEFSTFASTYPSDTHFVVWLDYTSPKERLLQLQEFSKLIGHFQPFDIVKITMNANINTLGAGDRPPPGFQTIREWRLQVYQSQLGQFPSNPTVEEMDQLHFPRVLARSIAAAGKRGIETFRDTTLRPLSVFSYSDGPHNMLSSAWIVLPQSEADSFMHKPPIANWPYLAPSWEDVARINVPDLSTREKLHIDRLLLSKGDDEISQSFGFFFGKNETESIEQVSQYRRHYRFYPHFMRVSL
jgi:hypothetical protein